MSNCETAPLSPELEARFLEPYLYIQRHVRRTNFFPKYVQALNHWLAIPQDKLEIIGAVIEMLNTACNLLDDIQDSSLLRRGIPVAHSVYGIPLTINAANCVYFLAIQKLLDGFPAESCAAGVRILTEQWLQMHRGQGVEMYWRDAFICPTEEEYFDQIGRKAAILGMVVGLMQLFSEDKRDFGNLIKIMGWYIQIANDYENFKSKAYEEFKGYADDLTEGKFSFPILHAIRHSPDDKSLLNILKQRTEDVQMKKYAVSRMEELGSLAYTRKVMNEMFEKTLAEIEKLGGNDALKGLFEYLKKKQL